MKKVLDEMNTHPDARFFYALQERGRLDENGTHLFPQMTIGIVTGKVNSGYYTRIADFVEDMTTIFSDCPQESTLAAGAATLEVLFSELLDKHTSFYVTSAADCETTPPGRKKRFPFGSRIQSDNDYGCDEFEEFMFTGPEVFELQTDEQAALLELTEGIATIEAELQMLKDTEMEDVDSSHPGYSTHEIDMFCSPAYSLGSAGLFASSAQEGRSAMNQTQQTNKKRSRRKLPKPSNQMSVSGAVSNGRRQQQIARSPLKRNSSKYDLVSKEQLLHIITNDLPPKFLEGVIRIVNPLFDPDTASDEDLEFDINSLDDEVLYKLQQYVYSSISLSPKTSSVVLPHQQQQQQQQLQNNSNNNKRREQPKRRAAKRETPKSRLRNQHKRIAASATSQLQKSRRRGCNNNKKKNGLSGPELMSEIFQSEEIVRIRKSLDDEDEDEDVDILA